jgi:hypothetical protein
MSAQTIAIVVGSITGISLVGFLLNKYYQTNNVAKYQYTNTGMSDEGLTDYNDGYTPKFGVGGKKNKTKRKKKQSKKNK